MDIDQLRQAVNSMSPSELQDFSSEASFRQGVSDLLGKPVQDHILAAARHLISERLLALGLRPRDRKRQKREPVVHTIDRSCKTTGHNGKVVVTKVSPEDMEKLWT